MIVVSDTSCVTNLLAIGQGELLSKLFGDVVVPDAVWRELKAEHKSLPEFLRVASVRNTRLVSELVVEPLDRGEAEAIALAQELHAEYLLMDETDGRAVAIEHGLRVIGLVGILRRAKDRGLIAAIKPLLISLRDDAGFWLSSELFKRVILESGEE